MKTLRLLPVLFLFGCGATQQFVTIGNPQTRPQKQVNDILVFSDPSQVPWPYQTIGELIPDRAPLRFQNSLVQIDDIKREAAKNGADAVILHQTTGSRGNLFIGQGTGFGSSESVVMFSGTAIVKKDQVTSLPSQ